MGVMYHSWGDLFKGKAHIKKFRHSEDGAVPDGEASRGQEGGRAADKKKKRKRQREKSQHIFPVLVRTQAEEEMTTGAGRQPEGGGGGRRIDRSIDTLSPEITID